MNGSDDEKTRWNAKYSAGWHTDLVPDEFLASSFDRFLAGGPPGYALDLAGGAGRHALWLVQRGWKVKLIDISDVALRIATERSHGLPAGVLTTEIRDVSASTDIGEGQFDLILVFYFLERQLFPALIRALKPGGIIIYRTYTIDHRRFADVPSRAEFLLDPGELHRVFSSLEILHHGETDTGTATAELVARKQAF